MSKTNKEYVYEEVTVTKHITIIL